MRQPHSPLAQDVHLDHGIAAEHLRCKAYVGPQAALTEGVSWQPVGRRMDIYEAVIYGDLWLLKST